MFFCVCGWGGGGAEGGAREMLTREQAEPQKKRQCLCVGVFVCVLLLKGWGEGNLN